MNDLIDGMVRKPDHSTSVAAAQTVKRQTLRQLVEEHALGVGGRGFIDDDLKAAWPDSPESSVRKRRSEMAEENLILETGRTRLNRKGQSEKVWMHRQFHHNPPPIVERQKKPSRADEIVRLEAEVTRLKHILDANSITY